MSSDNKIVAKKIQTILQDLGNEIPLGHCYELIAKMEGFKSWNVASTKQSGEQVFRVETPPTLRMTSDKVFQNKILHASSGQKQMVPGAVAFLGEGKNVYEVKLVTQTAEAKIYLEVRADSENEASTLAQKFIENDLENKVERMDWEVIWIEESHIDIQHIQKMKPIEKPMNYKIIDDTEGEPLLIVDKNEGKVSVTNSTELVIEKLMTEGLLPLGRKLYYIDSMGYKDEVLRDSKTGRFKGFAPAPKRDEFIQLHLISKRLFNHYGHEKPDPENCGACALTMEWKDEFEGGPNAGPNYAAWTRAYVEARKPIPAKWKDAFERERKSENKGYAKALERSIKYFGVSFK